MTPTPCHVPTCTAPAGPSGFCATHRNRLNARANGLLDHMTLADRIAIAAHPGWRGRKCRLMPLMWEDGLFFHTSPKDGIGPDYKTAAEALAELDRLNGLPAAADLDALRARLAEVGRERDAARQALAEMDEALTEAESSRDTARRRVGKLEQECDAQRHRAEAAEDALTDARAIARGLLPPPPPTTEPPVTLGESTIATVATLLRERDAFATAADEYRRQAVWAFKQIAALQSDKDRWRSVAQARGWGIVALAVALAAAVVGGVI